MTGDKIFRIIKPNGDLYEVRAYAVQLGRNGELIFLSDGGNIVRAYNADRWLSVALVS